MPLFLLLLGAAVAALLWAVVRVRRRRWRERHTVPASYALEERLETADGAAIELRRLPLPETLGPEPCQRGLPPVLLAHGLGANHRVWDLSRDLSLAPYLSQAGRDVWLVTLRSSLTRLGVRSSQCRFSNLVQYDLPLAVDTVLDRTGRNRVDFVGYSLGGMLLYAAIARSLAAAKIRRVTLLAAPAWVELPLPWTPPPWLHLGFARLLPSTWLTGVAGGASLLPRTARQCLFGSLANACDVAPTIADRVLVNVTSDIPMPLLRDLSPGRSSQHPIPRPDGEALLGRLGSLCIPALFIAGGGDRTAPAEAVEAAYRAWGAETNAPNKRLLLVGGNPDVPPRYGHADLLFGRRVRQALHQPVAMFLNAGADSS